MRTGNWFIWLSLTLLLGLSAGCGRFTASRMATAPNRYPRWLAPEAQTRLSFPPAFLDAFPVHTLEVGPPPARLRYRLVPPADYAVSVTHSNRYGGGARTTSFQFTAQLPAPTNALTARPRGLLFVLHGYGAEAALMMPLALRLAQEGWLCVVPDLRGHGKSSGARISFGVVEARDLSALLDAVSPEHPVAQVAVVGHSYGGSLALRWRLADERVDHAIALATYARLVEAGENIRSTHTPWFPEALSQAGLRALPALLGVGPGELDPATIVQRTPAPALFIVGMDDTLTPPLASSRLATLTGPDSRLVLVPEADHESLPYYFEPVVPAILDWIGAGTRERQSRGLDPEKGS